jgi:hypothetical protein
MMRRLITVALSLVLAGCATRTTYTEGTSLAVGAYLPIEGSLYGCEIASYLSGCRVSVPSNRTVKITRASVSYNSWFGVIRSVSTNDTTVTVK